VRRAGRLRRLSRTSRTARRRAVGTGRAATLLPPPLRAGDAIGVAAPSGPVRPEVVRRGIDYLRARGFRVVTADHLHARSGYLAGEDEDRLGDLRRLLADPALRAIWFARGGSGSARIVEGLDLAALRRAPKALVGYSDATVIHAAAWRAARLSTYYGPNVSDLGDPARFEEAPLWRALQHPEEPLDLPLVPESVLRQGTAEGVILGGCLSLVATLVGTPWEVPTTGAILFLEEVNEEPYRIDRMLGQLRQSGALARIRGLLVGQTVGCTAKDPLNDVPLAEILERHLGSAPVPIVVGFPMGHGLGKIVLPFGRRARIDTRAGRLTISAR
jgi:muramoyltetrapeptide carboxypeptidase